MAKSNPVLAFALSYAVIAFNLCATAGIISCLPIPATMSARMKQSAKWLAQITAVAVIAAIAGWMAKFIG
jgi:hypothetical protein